ncbi:MAG: NAD(P)-dependent oxidoreductase [Nitrosopumilaceae archaeon]|nr:NAD(P)-dependent oxidoreductase [Nitrosopumilaceae archaeon]
MKIGLIGTGMLGTAVGLNLLEKKYQIIAQNRTKEKTQELEKKGAKIVETPKDVAQECDFLITCVKDAEAVKDVAFGNNGIIKANNENLIVCDMSTINPLASKDIARQFSEHGVIMLDTPVMGGPNVAIKGELVMMVAGNKSSFEQHKEILDAIASKVFYLGENGTAHAIKLAMNLQIAMLALSLSEGITLARGANVDPKIFLEILNSTYFKTGMSENKAFKMIEDKFEPTFLLRNLKKDLHTINESAESFNLKLPMSSMAEEIYQKAIDDGFGDLDYTGILAYLKNNTALDN